MDLPMSITLSAIYENGVFHPTEPVALPDGSRVEITLRTHDAGASPTAEAAPLAGLAALATSQPVNPNLPTDLAAQHNHYLYGSPKRP
jgi:predicted DNA-binding antitoxin AbrB/MazE fold protein